MLEAEQILHERYQLKQQLGHNAGRQTWLAEDIRVSPPELVVVKLLAFGGDVNWDDLKLFEREAQVLKQLNHPRIPKYLDYFNIDDRVLWFCLVHNYIPGSSLKEKLNQGKRFTEGEVRQIAVDVLKILEFLHQLNPAVLHRDIKPSNLILGDDGQIYVIDFGSVQDRASQEGATFTVVGTYGYAPMEQFGGRAVPASDLYGLGATLIHLLTGTAPADLPQRNLRICFKDQVNLSANLISWIQKLTEPAPEQRFKSASEAILALELGMTLNTRKSNKLSRPTRATFVNNSGQGGLGDPRIPIPDEIKGWNWGAFLIPWFWPMTNNVWIGLIAWVPQLGWLMAIALGAKGNEWAWKSRRWRSIEHFKAHQRGWAIVGILFGAPLSVMLWILVLGLVSGF
ncbi:MULTISPECIES: serine/threonine-protein kinase [unclassified Moorena]|uniref:serine/threonine protein kinase n=1 Tax=unclassified Moorena TaxID=2683338 RepID=UPI0013C672CD|nr:MULTISPECIES: serine/threonine-protein kinase [unclassified Moorena]NEO19850.1 serine/threonine protein kinase [Moorena sp. SIO4A5]NEP25950.1 serine/threonine protein kinase [Moorena sp. SIO3I6]NEQ57083.1 serine/threonine protein kinase [Moorena sp. SIO4A1]